MQTKIDGKPAEVMQKPLKLKSGNIIKNRFFKSAMSEGLGDKFGAPTENLIHLYATWASGGTGLITTGNVMIDSRALGEPRNVVLEDESNLEMLTKWAQAGTQNGAQVWMQLNHPGKQIPNTLCDEPVAPSAIPLGKGLEKYFNKPRELHPEEIEEIVDRFGRSAEIAKKAGFSGVQIHGAHGYLVSQFLSPLHNKRQDNWGGDAVKRRSFAIEILRSMRTKVGNDFPIGIKLNSADFMKGGFGEEESMELIDALVAEGIDLVEISGGSYESPAMTGLKVKDSTIKREAYFLDYAEKVRKRTDVPLVVTGGFRTSNGMADAISSGATDMVGLARPLAVEPELPNQILSGADFNSPVKLLNTGVKALDNMGLMNIIWYARQLHRLGAGKKTNPKLGIWSTLIKQMVTQGFQGFQKKRA